MMATIKGILIDSFQSKKWYRADRMHYAPSVHRTYLSETLARNFDPDRREKWLETVSSSLSPSKKPVDPAEATKAPTPQELRERYISNRASYLRIKSCPPEYMLPRRYYSSIIKRNQTFARESKTITGIIPIDTRDGESFRSFLLGARYTDLRYVSAGMIKKRDAHARSCSHPLKSKKVQDNAAPKIDTGLRTHPTSKAAPPHDLPTQDSTEAKKKVSRSSPLPIAVVGSKPSSPLQPDHDGSHSASLPNTETVGPTQTSGSVVESESNSNFNMEIINMEEASLHAMGESLAKPMEMIEENEQDFISLEAQKLTGAILEESELEEQEEDSKEAQDLHHKLPASSPIVPPQQDHEDTTDGIKQGAQGEGLASVHDNDSMPTVVEAVEVGVADVQQDHDKDMTSKSSTIFVDMTGLNIQSHEDLEPQS